MLAGREVQFVDDNEMPEGVDWLMIETSQMIVCAVRHSKVNTQVLEEAWEGYLDLVTV